MNEEECSAGERQWHCLLFRGWWLRSAGCLRIIWAGRVSWIFTPFTGWHYFNPDISPTLLFSVSDHVYCCWTSVGITSFHGKIFFQNWVRFLQILYILHNCCDLWLLGPFWDMHPRPKRRRSIISHFLPRYKKQSWICIYPALIEVNYSWNIIGRKLYNLPQKNQSLIKID